MSNWIVVALLIWSLFLASVAWNYKREKTELMEKYIIQLQRNIELIEDINKMQHNRTWKEGGQDE